MKRISNNFYKRVQKKIIIPIYLITLIFSIIFFLIGNYIWFNLNFSTVLIVIQDLTLFIYGVWGYTLYQSKLKGKLLFIWLVGFLAMFGVAFLAYNIFGGFRFYGRIFLIMSVPVVIGFVSLLYKSIKTNSISKRRMKILIISFIIFSIISTYGEEITYFSELSVTKEESRNIVLFSRYNDEKSVIITEFLWEYLFIYYGYQYDKASSNPIDIHKFITITEELILPENHISGGINILKEIKKNTQKDVYLKYTDYFQTFGGWQDYAIISKEQGELYYNLSYLNRICSSKDLKNDDNPIYWII